MKKKTNAKTKKKSSGWLPDEKRRTPQQQQQRYDAAREATRRMYCALLGLWRHCANRRCRHGRRCTGEAEACLRARVPKVGKAICATARAEVMALGARRNSAANRHERLFRQTDLISGLRPARAEQTEPASPPSLAEMPSSPAPLPCATPEPPTCQPELQLPAPEKPHDAAPILANSSPADSDLGSASLAKTAEATGADASPQAPPSSSWPTLTSFPGATGPAGLRRLPSELSGADPWLDEIRRALDTAALSWRPPDRW